MRLLISTTLLFFAFTAFSQNQVEKTITYSLDTTSATDFRIIEITYDGKPDDKNTPYHRMPIPFTDKKQVDILLENVKKQAEDAHKKANEYIMLANEWNTKYTAIKKLIETNEFFKKK